MHCEGTTSVAPGVCKTFCGGGHLATNLCPRLPLGVRHRVAKDDWYEGMLIPKDATVVIPFYAIHRSEKHSYANPHEFNPKRYLGHPKLASDYAGIPDFNSQDKFAFYVHTLCTLNKSNRFQFEHHYAYGAGRRICPEMRLAERTQWRAIAKLLWAFDIELPTDPATGEKIITRKHTKRELLTAHCRIKLFSSLAVRHTLTLL